jgi:hypothetical protein
MVKLKYPEEIKKSYQEKKILAECYRIILQSESIKFENQNKTTVRDEFGDQAQPVVEGASTKKSSAESV